MTGVFEEELEDEVAALLVPAPVAVAGGIV
jgi:hypothetical protein